MKIPHPSTLIWAPYMSANLSWLGETHHEQSKSFTLTIFCCPQVPHVDVTQERLIPNIFFISRVPSSPHDLVLTDIHDKVAKESSSCIILVYV